MRGIDRNLIKWIAMFSMLLDHTGYRLIYGDAGAPLYVRTAFYIIGRLAFPLFAFLLVDGFFRTRSKEKFFLRLFIWAIITEVPYDLMVHSRVFYFDNQNVLWTLLLGLSYMWVADFIKSQPRYKDNPQNKMTAILLQVLMGLILVYAASLLKADYGVPGVLFVILGYIFSDLSKTKPEINFIPTMLIGYILGYFVLAISFPNSIYSFPGAILIWQYHGKAGKRMPRWLGYSFYPLHMLLLSGIAFALNVASGGSYGVPFSIY